MFEITGVMYELFVSPEIAVPPVASVYHLYWPAAPPAATSVNETGPHKELPDTVGALGGMLTVAITGVRVLSQVPLLILA